MSQVGETFFTTVGCMDGRVQEPVRLFGQKKFKAVYPDTITEAGLAGLLAKESVDPALISSIKKKIAISLEKHHSRGIIVYGHQECAASDAVHDEQHKKDILSAHKLIRSIVPDIQVILAFVKREKGKWVVETLTALPTDNL